MNGIPYIAVIGSRVFGDYDLLAKSLDKFKPFVLVTGGVKGVDKLAEEYADKNGLLKIIIKPEWDTDGNGSGFLRNYDIIDKSDFVVAFWDLNSKGTKHSVEYAKRLKKRVYTVIFDSIN